MNKEMPEIDVTSEKPVTKKKRDYLRYILAAVFLIAAAVIYIKDLRENRAIQEDLNFIHYLVSEKNVVNHIDMMINSDGEKNIGFILRCNSDEVKAISEAFAKAEPETTGILEEEQEGKLFTFYLNCNSNAIYCVEAAVIDSNPENAYIRAQKPTLVKDEAGNEKIALVPTRPAVIKGFGNYLIKLYDNYLPKITAAEAHPATQNFSEQAGPDQKILIIPITDEEQLKEILQNGQAELPANATDPAVEAPAVEAPAVEAPAVEAPAE